MKDKLIKIVNKMIENNKTISTMESCTGGGLANIITNIKGASKILHFSAVTYSNEYKIKMGVSKKVIDEYSVYSLETAREMAKAISKFSKSNLGIGITGKLGVKDTNNSFGDDNTVYACIYNADENKYNDLVVKVNSKDRKDDKKEVLEDIVDFLNEYV